MKKSLCLIYLMSSLLTAKAADLTPPDWRGQSGSTFQQWDFHYEKESDLVQLSKDCSQINSIDPTSGELTLPDVLDNPYIESTGICVEFKSLWFITKRLDWHRSYNDRDGIWELQNNRTFENFLNFIIPNAEKSEETSTVIQVQIIYFRFNGLPNIKIQYPSNNNSTTEELKPVITSPETILPNDWMHSSITFVIEGCPRYESIYIYPPERTDTFIDSIAIDTLCTNDLDSIIPL
jgi:hypothetical protein